MKPCPRHFHECQPHCMGGHTHTHTHKSEHVRRQTCTHARMGLPSMGPLHANVSTYGHTPRVQPELKRAHGRTCFPSNYRERTQRCTHLTHTHRPYSPMVRGSWWRGACAPQYSSPMHLAGHSIVSLLPLVTLCDDVHALRTLGLVLHAHRPVCALPADTRAARGHRHRVEVVWTGFHAPLCSMLALRGRFVPALGHFGARVASTPITRLADSHV